MRFERITVNPNHMGGMPASVHFRIPVATVVAMVADGMTTQEMVGELPDLEPTTWPKRCTTPLKPSESESCPSATRHEVPRREPLPHMQGRLQVGPRP